jgi:4-aminobutyrate aminotransferase-like enzyme
LNDKRLVASLPSEWSACLRDLNEGARPRRTYDRSAELRARAAAVIPGGSHGTGRPLVISRPSPLYFEKASGSRIWDVDANEYIDLIMAKGPFVLGYAHPEVDDAAIAQLRNGMLMTLNNPLHVRFVDELLSRFPSAEMGLFLQNRFGRDHSGREDRPARDGSIGNTEERV